MLELFSFKGYTGRLGYLVVCILQIVFLAGGILLAVAGGGEPNAAKALAFIGGMLASVWVAIAGAGRRANDIGWPTWIGYLLGMFVPGGFLVLLIMPGSGSGSDDLTRKAEVFSDDEPKRRKAKAADGEAQPAWMQRALSQVSGPKAAAATSTRPEPRMTGAIASATGPRSEFGLRRW